MNLQNVSLTDYTDLRQKICNEMLEQLTGNLLKKWYPFVVDNIYGGYFTNINHDFKLNEAQDKMLVTQARHIWATSKSAEFLGDESYSSIAIHGYKFLKEKMWDSKYGGFFQVRNRKGGFSNIENFGEEKRTYGNAFAVFGLASLYGATNKSEVLELAKKTFEWIENNTFDNVYDGYYQFITRENKVFDKSSNYKTYATDKDEVGLKDQNSSIHLLEAYTELYNVWKNENLGKQLLGLLILIRDVLVSPDGYLRLFFQKDFTPVSFKEESEEVRYANSKLDHISFGHDYETAFLMLEASYALALDDDTRTLRTAKKLLDHSIENGWDGINGGFFDEGLYKDDNNCEIIKNSKNWWAQAEGLNVLLLFSKIFPEEKKYFELFLQQWEYIKEYLIDYENGDWYWSGLDKEPFQKYEPKGTIWKCTYHNGRALMNCINMLSDENFSLYRANKKFRIIKNEFDHFIIHWKQTALKL